eukprot:6844314-Prymnesium_polylepis.1
MLQELAVGCGLQLREHLEHAADALEGRERRLAAAGGAHVGGDVAGRHGDDREALPDDWGSGEAGGRKKAERQSKHNERGTCQTMGTVWAGAEAECEGASTMREGENNGTRPSEQATERAGMMAGAAGRGLGSAMPRWHQRTAANRGKKEE